MASVGDVGLGDVHLELEVLRTYSIGMNCVGGKQCTVHIKFDMQYATVLVVD